MRLHAVIALILAGTVACGGAAAPSKARSPGGAQRESVVSADRDADGIPDVADRDEPAPAEPSSTPTGNMMGAPAPKAPPPPPPPPGQAPKPEPQKPQTDQTVEPARDTSKIVYTAKVTMAVYQVEQGLLAVERLARETGGFLAVKHDRDITIRVPRARFQAILAQIEQVGEVLHRNIEAEDVTDQYADLEIRIRNARAMQARLQELLQKAPVKEALEIEKELHRITQELELLEGKITLLKDKIAYSTITVTFEPKSQSVQAARVRMPFPWLGELGLPHLLSLQEYK